MSTEISVDSTPVRKNQGRANYNLMPEDQKFYIPDIYLVLSKSMVYKNFEEINSLFIPKLVELHKKLVTIVPELDYIEPSYKIKQKNKGGL